MESIRYTLTGRIPSKKNSKMIVPNWKAIKSKLAGRNPGGQLFWLFPSSAHKKWHGPASAELMAQPRKSGFIENISKVIIEFSFGDRRKADLTNKAESVMDLLVDNKIIIDDSWQEVPKIETGGGYEKGNFSAEIIIFYEKAEISEVF